MPKAVPQRLVRARLSRRARQSIDEVVEVTFTVSPRVRRIAAHDPDGLPIWEYFRQIYWGSGVDFDLPEDSFEQLVQEVCLDAVELPPGERAILSIQLPSGFVIAFEPVTHCGAIHRGQGRTDARAPEPLPDLR